MAGPRTEVAVAPPTETRSVWLPDEWAGYIACGDDPESPDWPVSRCDEELRRLRLEGFDTVACTDDTKELHEYRGIAGTLRRYEALRTGGDDLVTRRVTLVRRSIELPDGAEKSEVLVDAALQLTRTESQPIERLAARAVFDALGETRRAGTAAARHERLMPFYDHEGRLRCPVCDAVKRVAAPATRRGCPIFCPRCEPTE